MTNIQTPVFKDPTERTLMPHSIRFPASLPAPQLQTPKVDLLKDTKMKLRIVLLAFAAMSSQVKQERDTFTDLWRRIKYF